MNSSVLRFIQNLSSGRFVAELVKMRNTFIIPLLHPFATASLIASPTMFEYDDMSLFETPTESFEHLPIASRFLSPTGFQSDKTTYVPFPSRSHQSLPSPALPNHNAVSTHKKNLIEADLIANGAVARHQIPADLRQCLEVIEDSILGGHVKLSDGLRKRYAEQYPLVRSFADIFVAVVRLSIFLSCCPDLIALTFVLVSHF